MQWLVKFVEDDAQNPIQPAGGTLVKARKYCKWTATDMMNCQLKYYMHPGVSIKQFLKDYTTVPEKTFGTYWKESGLKNLQEADAPFEIAKIALESYVARVKKNVTKRTTAASESNRYLTEQQEKTMVSFALMMGRCGRGIDRDELLGIINQVINVGVDERERKQATDQVVKDILRRHPDVMKLVNAGSLDPLRAKKATEKTRDTVFSKLQAQTRGLYSEGKIPWKNYSDIPSQCIYNIDGVGTDTTKHRRKVIADKRDPFQRIFAITPEGDRMKGHITACITTRADGTSKDC